jgi:hypothetical protein
MAEPLGIPVVLITFNRPDVTKRVLDRILEAKPSKLYFFNDAPREGNENDAAMCRQIREMASAIEFEGELLTRFEEKNLGCKGGESTAMTWLFENEEMGIVIEDDTLPSLDFFFWCKQMLHKYKDDPRVYSITGCNMLNEWKADKQDYHFAMFGSFWAWAGWQRAWKHYDVDLKLWQNPDVRELVLNYLPTPELRALRTREFDRLVEGRISTWDFQFCFLHYIHHALSVVPAKNMVTNIGINRPDAVHMKEESPFSDLKYYEQTLPVRENSIMVPDVDYDHKVLQKAYPWLFESAKEEVPKNQKTGIKKYLNHWLRDA